MDPRLRTYLLWQKQRGLKVPLLRQSSPMAPSPRASIEAAPTYSEQEVASPRPIEKEPLASFAAPPSTAATTLKVLIVFVTDHASVDGSPLTRDEAALFDKMAAAMNLAPHEWVVTSALEAPLPAAGDELRPSGQLLRAAGLRLEPIIAQHEPALVICLGRLALSCLLGPEAHFRSLAGQELHARRGSPPHRMLATYHPRDLLRHPENKRETWHHLQRAMDWLGLNQRRRPSNP